MKNDRTPRTSVDLGGARPSGPTVQSQLIERPTPRADVNAGSAFGGLSEAFSGFFNFTASRALDKSAETAKAAKEKEVLRLTAKAQADFAAGRGRDQSLVDSDVYNKAFSAVLGDRDGRRLAADITSHISELPLEADAFKAGQEYLAASYGNGTDDPVVDALVFKYAQDAINSAVEGRTTARQGIRVQQRIDAIGESVQEYISSGEELSPESVNNWVQLYAGANPAESAAARPKVMAMVIDASDSNDASLEVVNRYLNQPGSGMNGKSYAESFPQEYDAIQRKLIDKRRATGSLEAVNSYSKIKEQIASARTTEDLIAVAGELSLSRHRYGEGADYGQLRTAFQKRLDDLSEAEAVRANLGMFVQGNVSATSLEWEDVREEMPSVIESNGGAVLTDDVDARRVGASLHLNVPKAATKTRDQLATALLSQNDGDRAKAFRFLMDYAQMEARNGQPDFEHVAQKFLFGNETAKALFIRAGQADLVSDESVNELLSQYLASPNFDPAKVSLTGIDENAADARTAIDDHIADVLGNALDDSGIFGTGISMTAGDVDFDVEDIDPTVLQHIRSRFRFLWGRAGARGDTWEDDLTAVTQAAVSGLGFAIQNGRRVLTFARPMRAATERGYRTVKPLSTKAINPVTGAEENTISEAQAAVSDVAERLGFSSEDVVLEPGAQGLGYYPLKVGGSEYIFELGGKSTLADGTEIDLPEDPAEATAILAEHFGDIPGVDVQLTTAAGRPVLKPVYRPVWDTAEDVQRKRLEERYRRADDIEAARAARPELADRVDEFDAQRQEQLDSLERLRRGEVGNPPALVTTKDSALKRFLDMLTKQRRESGQVAPSTGITTPGPTSMQELEELEKTYTGRVGMRKTSPTYARNLYGFLKESEGFRTRAYKDHKGSVHVGVGFNMDAGGARDRFEKALPDVDFDDVYHGDERLTDAQVRRLFDATIDTYEKYLDGKIGDVALTEHQRIALVSMAFNSQIGDEEKTLIGPNLTRLVQSGDWEGVVNEILFRSNASKHKGLQNRRVAEAQMFSGKANPLPDNLIAASY